MYIRTAPQTGKATDTGLRAEPGAVYERIKRIIPKKFDKPSLLSDVKGYENGEMVYVWSLIQDPGKDEPLGWIVSSESVRLDGERAKAELLKEYIMRRECKVL